MRSPIDIAAEEAKAAADSAIDHAVSYLGRLQRLGALRKAYADPDEDLRYEARVRITMTPSIPEHLRAFVGRLLETPPEGKHTYRRRDAFIACAVEQTIDRGFAATRNPATRNRESACSIVASALARPGVNLSARTVEDIWNKATGSKVRKFPA